MWILLDNYDSFTYILQDYILQTGNDCKVYRNDELSVEELKALQPERIIISPGPETPRQAGITMDVIHQMHQTTPILGVCLGHQALGMYFGASLYELDYPMHGKTSSIHHNDHELYNNISSPCEVMRYHSLAIKNISDTGLTPLAHTEDKTIMAIAHNEYPCIGIQYHPESIGTNDGIQLLKNWADMYR